MNLTSSIMLIACIGRKKYKYWFVKTKKVPTLMGSIGFGLLLRELRKSRSSIQNLSIISIGFEVIDTIYDTFFAIDL